MKKSLLLSVCLLCSTSLLASKARVYSLQGARFINDLQFVFDNPALIHNHQNNVTFELGDSSNTGSPKAEGGIFRNVGSYNAAFYIGHMLEDEVSYRSTNSFTNEENPLEVFWGKKGWGASLSFSRSDDETTDSEQQTIGARFGLDNDAYEFFVNANLLSSAEGTNKEYTNFPYLRLGYANKKIGNGYLYAEIEYGKVEEEGSAITNQETDILHLEARYLDTSIQKDKFMLYYGPGVIVRSDDIEGKKINEQEIKFYLGATYQVKEWLELRSSISQNILYGNSEDETQTAPNDEKKTLANNTTVTVGFGLNYGDLTVDAVFAGSTTGKFNGNDVMTNLGLTYNF